MLQVWMVSPLLPQKFHQRLKITITLVFICVRTPPFLHVMTLDTGRTACNMCIPFGDEELKHSEICDMTERPSVEGTKNSNVESAQTLHSKDKLGKMPRRNIVIHCCFDHTHLAN